MQYQAQPMVKRGAVSDKIAHPFFYFLITLLTPHAVVDFKAFTLIYRVKKVMLSGNNWEQCF